MNVAIILTELKEVKKESAVYYYGAKELSINKDTSGLLEFDLKLFDIYIVPTKRSNHKKVALFL